MQAMIHRQESGDPVIGIARIDEITKDRRNCGVSIVNLWQCWQLWQFCSPDHPINGFFLCFLFPYS
jgi:hypothetical protein